MSIDTKSSNQRIFQIGDQAACKRVRFNKTSIYKTLVRRLRNQGEGSDTSVCCTL